MTRDVVRFFTLIGFIFLGFCAGFYAIFKPLCFGNGQCTYDYVQDSVVFNAASWPDAYNLPTDGSAGDPADIESRWENKWIGNGLLSLTRSVRFLMFTMIGQADVEGMQQKAYTGAPSFSFLMVKA